MVETTVKLGDICWPIEVTLTNRDEMGFRMLLGRAAVRKRFVVDPGSSFKLSDRITGKKPKPKPKPKPKLKPKARPI